MEKKPEGEARQEAKDDEPTASTSQLKAQVLQSLEAAYGPSIWESAVSS